MDNRTETLTLRLSKKEKSLIEKCAEATCLSITDFLVLSILSVGGHSSCASNSQLMRISDQSA